MQKESTEVLVEPTTLKDKVLSLQESEELWENSTWPERLDLLRGVLGLTSDSALARELCITKTSVRRWRSNLEVPGKHKRVYLKELFIKKITRQSDLKANALLATTAMCTNSIEAITPILQTAMDIQDLATLHTMTYLMAVKISSFLLGALYVPCVPTITTVYGAFPARSKMTITFPQAENKIVEIITTHTTRKPCTGVIHVKLINTKTKRERELALVANDIALSCISKRIVNFLTNNKAL